MWMPLSAGGWYDILSRCLSVAQRSSSQLSVSPGRQQMAQIQIDCLSFISLLYLNRSHRFFVFSFSHHHHLGTRTADHLLFFSNLDYEDVPGVTGRQNMVYCPRRYCHPPSQSLSLLIYECCAVLGNGAWPAATTRLENTGKVENATIIIFRSTSSTGRNGADLCVDGATNRLTNALPCHPQWLVSPSMETDFFFVSC